MFDSLIFAKSLRFHHGRIVPRSVFDRRNRSMMYENSLAAGKRWETGRGKRSSFSFMGIVPKWVRPPGPLNVWKVVDGYETLDDGTKKAVKFSMQEIPNDEKRRQEVLDLMCTHYLAEAPFCKSLKIKDADPHGAEDFVRLFEYSLDQGIAIGCYKLDSTGAIKDLVGANLILLQTQDTKRDIKQMKTAFKSQNFMMLWEFYENLECMADVSQIYSVDKYIASVGLSVLPSFRGQKLGLHLLDSRSSIGKKYGVSTTMTLFSAHSSQIQAKRLGYEEKLSINFEDLVDDQGNPLFPNIDSECAKIMMKRFF